MKIKDRNSHFSDDSKKRPKFSREKMTKGNNDNRQNKNDNFQWQKASKNFLFWLVIIIMTIWISRWFTNVGKEEHEITYKVFKEYLEKGLVSTVEIRGDELHGKLKEPQENPDNYRNTITSFFVILPPKLDISVVNDWIDKYGIDPTFKSTKADWWSYLLQSVPFILIILFWFVLLRRMQSGGQKGIFSFGKSRAKLLPENKMKVTFKDVAGADEAKQEVMEIIEFLKEPEKFQRLGGKIPKGALLLGPPGTGKTLLAKAVAGEADVPFFSMSGADFVEMFVGVGASRVRDLFEQGKKNAPCIIFIDEIDAVGRHRGAGLGGGHDEREQTLNQLLVEMDGFESNEGVILLAATNRPDVLDSALLRPGRFDRQIIVDLPDVRGREGILKVHTQKISLDKKVDLSILAKGTPGFSGADLANMVNEAALLASRKNKKKVEMEDFEDAKDKVMMGAERRSLLLSDAEKRKVAYHESGHVLVEKLDPGGDPVRKVTIIPRGRALGLTSMLPEESYIKSKSYWLATIRDLMGGRAAEQIIFGEYSTGAGNDIKTATDIAHKMVCEWGMSEKLGPLSFGKKHEEIFLGREISQHRDYSEQTAQTIDAEVKQIVTEAYERALKILNEHVEKLHALAQALLEKEIIVGDEIDRIIDKVNNKMKNGDNGKNKKTEKKTTKKTTKKGTKDIDENKKTVVTGKK